MDKKTAVSFVERIEAHREEERAIWREMRDRPDYEMYEDNSIKDILEARAKAAALLEDALSGLDAFDWVDDGDGNFVPREELAS